MDPKLKEFELNYKYVSKDMENNIVVGLVRATGKLEDVHTIEILCSHKRCLCRVSHGM